LYSGEGRFFTLFYIVLKFVSVILLFIVLRVNFVILFKIVLIGQ
jgi:hypothetical protein